VDDFERQPSYLAAVVGNSEASKGSGGYCISTPGNCTTRDASQELQNSTSHNGRVLDENNCQQNKHSGSLKNEVQMTAAKYKMSVNAAPTNLCARRFGDLAKWLQNGEDDTTINYIDRRMVESVLKCRQFHKQFPEKKCSSQQTSHRLNCDTNVARVGGGGQEAGQQGQCQPTVTDDLYQEFNGKLETEVDDDSGFSGDRNSASSTSSGFSVESSLTSLGSVTDFLSGTGSATSVLSVDQSSLKPAPTVSHIPGPVPVPARTTSLSSSTSQLAPDVQSSHIASGQLNGPFSRRKTVEPSSQSCRPPEISGFHNQQPSSSLPSAGNFSWCSADGFLSFFL